MPQIPQSAIEEMLKVLPKKQRDRLTDVAYGNVTHLIKCQSKKCKGRVIGEILSNGSIREIESDGQYWLRSTRKRFDGFTGVECWCGNDSRLAKQEEGLVGAGPPSRENLETIYERLQKNPAKYPEKKGKQEVDGFVIEAV